jgi:hypothetical protein
VVEVPDVEKRIERRTVRQRQSGVPSDGQGA